MSNHLLLITTNIDCSAEEAGYYLATFKQFEHKPPDLIKERVDKDYHSVLRTALTSISKVNKTDVEMLRTAVGVCRKCALLNTRADEIRRALET